MTEEKLIRSFFSMLEHKDLNQLMSHFVKDAQLIDPHYPQAHMRGKDQIYSGLTWSFKNIIKFNFKINAVYKDAEAHKDDTLSKFAVQADTSHVIRNGKTLYCPQVYIFEIKDSKILKLHSYVPYGPHGMLNIVLKVTRFYRKWLKLTSLHSS